MTDFDLSNYTPYCDYNDNDDDDFYNIVSNYSPENNDDNISITNSVPLNDNNNNNINNDNKITETLLKQQSSSSILDSGVTRVHINSSGLQFIERKSDDIVGVVITICSGQSYDLLFRKVPQLSPEGIVVVYHMRTSFTHIMLNKFRNKLTEDIPILQEVFDNINRVNPSSVVFNWECSSSCSSGGFSSKYTIRLMYHIIKHGFMVMCSDFSVKALIADWNPKYLGPNPFYQVAEFDGSLELYFEPNSLLDCPSVQLQKLGELCDKGNVVLDALGGTIAFSADVNIIRQTKKYDFSLLSLVTKLDKKSVDDCSSDLLTLGRNKGYIGHALLQYKSKGSLLVSSAHWIELSKINTTEESVIRVASNMYGSLYACDIQYKLANAANDNEKNSLLTRFSAQLIQYSTPGQYTRKYLND